jgi:hypothetical protein
MGFVASCNLVMVVSDAARPMSKARGVSTLGRGRLLVGTLYLASSQVVM